MGALEKKVGWGWGGGGGLTYKSGRGDHHTFYSFWFGTAKRSVSFKIQG